VVLGLFLSGAMNIRKLITKKRGHLGIPS